MVSYNKSSHLFVAASGWLGPFPPTKNESHLPHWLSKNLALKVSVKDITKSGLPALPVCFCHLQPHFLLHSLLFSETRERNHRGAFHFCFEKKKPSTHVCTEWQHFLIWPFFFFFLILVCVMPHHLTPL